MTKHIANNTQHQSNIQNAEILKQTITFTENNAKSYTNTMTAQQAPNHYQNNTQHTEMHKQVKNNY